MNKRQQDEEEQQQKIAEYLDGIKSNLKTDSKTNNNEFSQSIYEKNPFFKRIDRHYGTFKAKIKGNYLKAFESLSFPSLKPLGRNGTGVRRKAWHHKDFTAQFYSNGTITIKPFRKKGLNPDELHADFWNKAKKSIALLEKEGLFVSDLKMVVAPKYGVEDRVAKKVNREFHGKHRNMDKSPEHGHIDNKGTAACKRDLRLSKDQHEDFAEELARARLDSPELLESIERKMNYTIDVQAALAQNLDLHQEILIDISKALCPKRPYSKIKGSSTLKGVS